MGDKMEVEGWGLAGFQPFSFWGVEQGKIYIYGGRTNKELGGENEKHINHLRRIKKLHSTNQINQIPPIKRTRQPGSLGAERRARPIKQKGWKVNG
jgi:hypothetical protein